MVDVARGMREDLEAAITEVEAAEAAPEPAEKPVEPAVTETPEAPEPATGERPRGPDGKFLPKAAAEEAPPVDVAVKPTQEEAAAKPDDKAASPAKASDPIAAATARWSQADKAVLAKLPPEAQQFLVRRHTEMEADHTKKTQAIAEFRKEYEPVEQLFQPFLPQMQQQGFTRASLIKAWADVEQQLIQGKGVDVIARIVKDYRIDPGEVAKTLGLSAASATAPQTVQSNAAAVQLDPEVDKLLQGYLTPLLAPIQKQLADVTGFTQQQRDQMVRQQQQQRDQEMSSANQTVQQFIDAVGKDGQPLHPHYAEVESFMVTLATAERAAGRRPDLEQIYDQAVYATPTTRAKLLAAQTAAQEATRQAQARAKATASRNAAVSVTGAPTGGPAPRTKKEPASIREALMEAAAEADDAA